MTCAVAAGWAGAIIETRQLRTVADGDVLRCEPAENGRQVSVVTTVDGDMFTEAWLTAVKAASGGM